MADISGINSYNYDPLVASTQNNSQPAASADTSGVPTESVLPSVTDMENAEVVTLMQNSSGLMQAGVYSPPSLASMAASMENLQAIEGANLLNTDPALAQSVLDQSGTSSIESLAGTLDNLQAVEGSNLLQNNPALAQSILQGTTPSDSSSGSLLDTTA
ncbi:MAG TPA: hypothetical protein VF790_11640 [Dissulfurispiraceae bacterium]